MSAPTPHPPIPRQPIGATFLVAISLLAAVALLQCLAVVWHVIPEIKRLVRSSAAQPQAEQTPAPIAQATQNASSLPAVRPADLLKAQKMFADADSSYRVGNFEAALKTIKEVELLMPGDPSVLMRKAQILKELGQPSEAVAALEEVLKYPGLPAQTRALAQKTLAQLSALLSARPAVQPLEDRPMAYADGLSNDMRDGIGLQPGASLGIVDARIRDSQAGVKSLRIAVKSRPSTTITVQNVKIYIYFYEKTEDGEILITDSKVMTQWLSPPADWAADEPELLDGQYTVPGDDGSGRNYYGYIVAVYYNKELQDFRSEPTTLVRDFPLPLYLK